MTGFDAGAAQALLDHGWPGNVRELDHAVERAVLLCPGERIGAGDLALRVTGEPRGGRLEDMSLEEVEAFLIKKTLSRFEGNVTRAADALGLSRSALYRRIERHGL